MRHIEEEVVLAELNLLAVVVELRHALSANHNESMTIETKLSLGQRSEVLHDDQLVAIVYPQGVSTSSGYKIFYLHFVLFLQCSFFTFWVQNSAKISEIQCSIYPKMCSFALLLRKNSDKEHFMGYFDHRELAD